MTSLATVVFSRQNPGKTQTYIRSFLDEIAEVTVRPDDFTAVVRPRQSFLEQEQQRYSFPVDPVDTLCKRLYLSGFVERCEQTD